jgi:hypothetical protein
MVASDFYPEDPHWIHYVGKQFYLIAREKEKRILLRSLPTNVDRPQTINLTN